MMRLAILIRNFSKTAGGAESYAVQLAHALRDDCEITVVSQTFDESPSFFKHIKVPKLMIKSRWLNQLWFNFYTKKVTRIGFDIVHSHENVTHGKIQTVHVKTVTASLAEKGMSLFRIFLSPRLPTYLWLEKKRLTSKSGINIFVSQMLLDETKKNMKNLSSSIFIPPGVFFPNNELLDEVRKSSREKYGIYTDVMTIGFVAHDFKKKGLDVLLKAINQVPFDVHLLVIGNLGQAQNYKKMIGHLNHGKACTFLGVTNNMSEAYAALDCLAHPTTQDVFPMTLLEAMAFGIPVITTKQPFNTMANLLKDGFDALLLENPYDAIPLACAIEKIKCNNNLKVNLIKNGREFAKKYDWSVIKDRYLKIYRESVTAGIRSF